MKGGSGKGFSAFKIYSPVYRHQGINGLVDFPLEHNRIVKGEAPDQFRFGFNGKIRGSQKPLVRAYDIFIIHLFIFVPTLVLLISLMVGVKKFGKGQGER
jgi:hypothetical protein